MNTIEYNTKRKAHCLSCDATWTPKNGTAMQPPRCPSCFSRKTVWDDEYQSLADKPESENKPVTTTICLSAENSTTASLPVEKKVETPAEIPVVTPSIVPAETPIPKVEPDDVSEDDVDDDCEDAEDFAEEELPQIHYTPEIFHEKQVRKPYTEDGKSSVNIRGLLILTVVGIGGYCLFKFFTKKSTVKPATPLATQQPEKQEEKEPEIEVKPAPQYTQKKEIPTWNPALSANSFTSSIR